MLEVVNVRDDVEDVEEMEVVNVRDDVLDEEEDKREEDRDWRLFSNTA